MFRTEASTQYSRVSRQILFYSTAALGLLLVSAPAKAQKRTASKADFCSHLGKTMQASSGAQMYCFGPQRNGSGNSSSATPRASTALANVDAASRSEDRTNSGAYIGGQSETSISAAGNYVVEAWNDGTGFFAGCGSPNYKEEGTGYGFSNDGGRSFTDLGGLPNINCRNGSRWVSDPSVGTYSNSGFTYFYVSAMYSCSSLSGCPNQTNGGVAIGLSACEVTGATLSCGQPTIVATGNCNGVSNTTTTSCFPFLDKDYLAVDQKNKRLYITYTDFTQTTTANFSQFTEIDDIDLAACDLDNPMAPVCSNGVKNPKPYLTLQHNVLQKLNFQTGVFVFGCEQEGAYPAVRESTGDVYVGYEYNWFTNFLGTSKCVDNEPTLAVVKHVPPSCLPEPGAGISTCTGPFPETSNLIISTDADFIPGYNRFPMNDFPRIAVSERYKTLSLVWNDARNTPQGDILLQSYDLDDLDYIQGSPVRLNSDNSFEDMHILPGLKNASSDGLINVTWYDRRGANAGTGKTDVYGALNVNPRTTSSPGSNLRITNQSTDWLATGSVIIPNFGDYNDNFVSASNTLFVAWADGRSGVPQPYEAHAGVH